jgi:hypothetical protein
MKKDKNIQELQKLDKTLSPFGFRVNDKGEIIIIGERDGKEYKIGTAKRRIISGEEMEEFLEKADKQEKESKK